MVIRNMEVFYFLCQMNVGYVNTYLMSLKCYGAVALVSLLIPEMVSVVIVTASAKAIFWGRMSQSGVCLAMVYRHFPSFKFVDYL